MSKSFYLMNGNNRVGQALYLRVNDSLKKDKDEYSSKIESYSKVLSFISDDGFTSLIDDVDLFEEVLIIKSAIHNVEQIIVAFVLVE